MVGWILDGLRGGNRSKRRTSKSSGSILRWITPSLTLTGVAGSVLAVLTGQVNLPTLDSWRGSQPPVYDDPMAETLGGEQIFSAGPVAGGAPVVLTTLGPSAFAKSDRSIRIATFNIQVFGKSKSEKPEVMRNLARIFQLFDVIAVQEVKGDPAIPINGLLDQLARLGSRYSASVSPPLGRTTQTECYAFFWDQTRIELVPQSDYLIDDSADRMHREPWVATFQTRVAPVDSRRPFSFSIINVHTDPDEVFGKTSENELNVLDDVFVRVRDWEYSRSGQEDFLLVGDLNVDVGGLAELGQIPNVVSVVGDVPTNSRRTKTYDHILLDHVVTREATGRAGVLDLQQFLGIDENAVLQISDHLPVWAEFGVYEAESTAVNPR